MFARVTTFQGSPDREARVLKEPVPPEIQALRGFKGAYALEDRKTGKAMVIALWETEADLNASAEAAKPVRIARDREAGATTEQVETFEVIFHP